jgi:hypothetical protein
MIGVGSAVRGDDADGTVDAHDIDDLEEANELVRLDATPVSASSRSVARGHSSDVGDASPLRPFVGCHRPFNLHKETRNGRV